jgi:four helix bundle protein
MDKNGISRKFEDVVAWQRAHQFVLDVYSYTAKFPIEEQSGLTSQFRKAAISIAANIAEGFKKNKNEDKLRFYNTSQGSLEECRYYLILAQDLNYGDSNNLSIQLAEVNKILGSYINSIEKNID